MGKRAQCTLLHVYNISVTHSIQFRKRSRPELLMNYRRRYSNGEIELHSIRAPALSFSISIIFDPFDSSGKIPIELKDM